MDSLIVNLPKSTTCLSSSQTMAILTSAAQTHLLSVSASAMKKATSLFVRKELNKLELVYKHWSQFLSVSSLSLVSHRTLVIFFKVWEFYFSFFFFLHWGPKKFCGYKMVMTAEKLYLIHFTCSIWPGSVVATTSMLILLERLAHWKGHCTYA